MSFCDRVSALSLFWMFLTLIKGTEAFSEQSAVLALSIFIFIPGLFLLTCCCSLIYVFHYRNKIPIFKSTILNVKKGAGRSASQPAQTAPPAAPPLYGATSVPQPAVAPFMPPPAAPAGYAGSPGGAPPAGKLPGNYEVDKPVEIDEVVVPMKKEGIDN